MTNTKWKNNATGKDLHKGKICAKVSLLRDTNKRCRKYSTEPLEGPGPRGLRRKCRMCSSCVFSSRTQSPSGERLAEKTCPQLCSLTPLGESSSKPGEDKKTQGSILLDFTFMGTEQGGKARRAGLKGSMENFYHNRQAKAWSFGLSPRRPPPKVKVFRRPPDGMIFIPISL